MLIRYNKHTCHISLYMYVHLSKIYTHIINVIYPYIHIIYVSKNRYIYIFIYIEREKERERERVRYAPWSVKAWGLVCSLIGEGGHP